MKYLSVIKALRGRAVMLEVGDVARQAVEVVRGFIWDVFYDNEITLVITFKNENVLKLDKDGKPAVADGKQVYEQFYEYYFKWIRTESILTIESDANIKINANERQLIKLKAQALYTDNLPGWPALNNALSKRIARAIDDLGLDAEFKGIYRNEDNMPIPEPELLTPSAPPVMIGIPAAVADKSPDTVTANTPPAPSAPAVG
jgi:hypothetical protein